MGTLLYNVYFSKWHLNIRAKIINIKELFDFVQNEMSKIKKKVYTLTKEKIVTSQTVREGNTDKFLDEGDKVDASLEWKKVRMRLSRLLLRLPLSKRNKSPFCYGPPRMWRTKWKKEKPFYCVIKRTQESKLDVRARKWYDKAFKSILLK